MKQKGFTLLELLVTLAVGSLVLLTTVIILNQVVFGSMRGNSQGIILNEINVASLRIKQDLMMTQWTTLTDGDPVPQGSVTLSWIDYTLTDNDSATFHTCTYSLTGTELLRSYDGELSIVGRNISAIGFTQNGKVTTCRITSTHNSLVEESLSLVFSVMNYPDLLWQ